MKKKAEVDWPTVLKYMGGGALVGGGAAAGAALVRLLLNLYADKNRANDTSLDDSVLYVNLKGTGKKQKKVKEASKKCKDDEYFCPVDKVCKKEKDRIEKKSFEKEAINSDTTTMSYLGMALAAYLGYSGVNKVFNKIREKRLQKELDLAQQVYIDRVTPEKSASVKEAISKPTFAMTVAKAIPLLIALGTAVAAYRLLDKHSPLPKKTSMKPKRIVLRSTGKRKDVAVGSSISDDDVENLVRTTMAKESRANANGMHDLVAFVGNGGFDKFKENFIKYGLETSMEMTKGARLNKASSVEKNFAIYKLSHDKTLQDSIGLLAASEYYDMSPGIMKAAQALPPETKDLILALARELLKKEAAKIYDPLYEKLEKYSAIEEIYKILEEEREKAKPKVVVGGKELIFPDPYFRSLNKSGSEKKAIMTEMSSFFALKRMLAKNKEEEEGGDVTTSGKLQVPSSKSSDDPAYKGKENSVYLDVKDRDAQDWLDKNVDVIDEALAPGPKSLPA